MKRLIIVLAVSLSIWPAAPARAQSEPPDPVIVQAFLAMGWCLPSAYEPLGYQKNLDGAPVLIVGTDKHSFSITHVPTDYIINTEQVWHPQAPAVRMLLGHRIYPPTATQQDRDEDLIFRLLVAGCFVLSSVTG